MKYLCIAFQDQEKLDAYSDEEFAEIMERVQLYLEELRDHGNFVDASRLQPASSGAVIQVRGGQMAITDGPFVETREQIAGYYLIEANDLNDAIRIAGRQPIRPARHGRSSSAEGARPTLIFRRASRISPFPANPSQTQTSCRPCGDRSCNLRIRAEAQTQPILTTLDSGPALDQCYQQFFEPIVRLVRAGFHSGLQHAVPVFLRRKRRVDAHQSAANDIGECHRVGHDCPGIGSNSNVCTIWLGGSSSRNVPRKAYSSPSAPPDETPRAADPRIQCTDDVVVEH